MTDYVFKSNSGDNNLNLQQTLASGDTLTVEVDNLDRLAIQADATGGTATPEVSNDGVLFVAVSGYAPSDPTTYLASVANGIIVIWCDCKYVKITASAGDVVVTLCGRRIGVFAQ